MKQAFLRSAVPDACCRTRPRVIRANVVTLQSARGAPLGTVICGEVGQGFVGAQAHLRTRLPHASPISDTSWVSPTSAAKPSARSAYGRQLRLHSTG